MPRLLTWFRVVFSWEVSWSSWDCIEGRIWSRIWTRPASLPEPSELVMSTVPAEMAEKLPEASFWVALMVEAAEWVMLTEVPETSVAPWVVNTVRLPSPFW